MIDSDWNRISRFDWRDEKHIKQIIDAYHYSGVDFNETSVFSNDQTPLQLAIENGTNDDIIQLMVKYGADTSVKIKTERTLTDDGERKGCAINCITLLQWAILSEYDERMGVLCKLAPNIINMTDSRFKMTSLHYAVKSGRANLVKLLLEYGADVNILDESKRIALHSAAYAGRMKIAKMLIESGSKLDEKNVCGDTPLHLAARQKHTQMVKMLIEHGAKLNIRNSKGVTPLWLVTYVNDADAVKDLIEHGADVNMEYKYGDDIWDYKIFFKDEPKRPWSSSMYASYGKTVLDYALSHDYRKIAELLIKAGAKHKKLRTIADCKKNGENMLLAFDVMPSLVQLKKMRKQGYDYEAPIVDPKPAYNPFFRMKYDREALRPMLQVFLCEALWRGDIEMAKFLIADGADLNPKGNEIDREPFDFYEDGKCRLSEDSNDMELNPIVAILSGNKVESLDFALSAGMKVKVGPKGKSWIYKLITQFNIPVLRCFLKHKVKLPYDIKKTMLSRLIDSACYSYGDKEPKVNDVIELFNEIDKAKATPLRTISHHKGNIKKDNQKTKGE